MKIISLKRLLRRPPKPVSPLEKAEYQEADEDFTAEGAPLPNTSKDPDSTQDIGSLPPRQ